MKNSPPPLPDRLPEPARYLPWLRQRDLLAPGLHRFGHDFGNGPADAQVFQFDRQFAHYRENSRRARQQLDKYYCTKNLVPETARAVNHFIVQQLCKEQPQWFVLTAGKLHCRLTGETVSLDGDSPSYIDLFDALASQVQEDIAVMQLDEQGNNQLCALHLCCPNHWGANQRIGENFHDLHKPVPGFNQATANAEKLIQGALQRGPYVRFAWGLSSDQQLNRHPDSTDIGRRFDKNQPLFVRVERQVLFGLPDINCLLFFIRTSFLDIDTLHEKEYQPLSDIIRSMQTDMQHYKGLFAHRDELLLRLETRHRQT